MAYALLLASLSLMALGGLPCHALVEFGGNEAQVSLVFLGNKGETSSNDMPLDEPPLVSHFRFFGRLMAHQPLKSLWHDQNIVPRAAERAAEAPVPSSPLTHIAALRAPTCVPALPSRFAL